MKTVILAGRCDHDNYGDSLMFAFYAKALEGNYEVYLLESSPEFTQRLIDDGLKVKNLQLDKLSDISDNAIVVFVGGGYFGQPEIGKRKWLKSFSNGYFPKIARRLKELKIPYIVQGVEVGPISSQAVSEEIYNLLSGAIKVVVRNLESLKFCEKIGVKNAKYLPDVVLATANKYYIETLEGNLEDEGYEIAIHVTGRLFSHNPLARINLYAIKSELKKLSPRNVAIFFDQSINQENLNRQAESLCEELNASGIKATIFPYSGHKNVLEIAQRSSVLITTKLHAGMSALSFGRKSMSISSAPKIKRFYKENNLEHLHCDYFFSGPWAKSRLLRNIVENKRSTKILDKTLKGSLENISSLLGSLEYKSFI